MKLKKILIDNILSYNKEIIEFNNDLNIFVGANGSGKSNLFNIIIYILKRYCYKNFEITRNYGIESVGHIKYSIREKNPLYNSSENLFLAKHKLLNNKISRISFTIKFEENDVNNLQEIKKYKKQIIEFLDYKMSSISFMDDMYAVEPKIIKSFFDIHDEDLMLGEEITINLKEDKNIWYIENDEKYAYMKYMKFFTLMYDILNLINVSHNIKNPFIFFEAYRNNSKETTMVGISDFNNNSYTNTQSIANMSNLAYSIGTNSTYIMLATKKYGTMHRNYIEQENGYQKFINNEEYINLKKFFKKFEYDINIKCVEPNNNIYQFYLKKENLEIEIDTVSSGEREIINFIFGLFLEQLKDGIVIIDEPELHLHPNWQKKLIQILREETKNRNIQIMFVTHSSSFISYSDLNNIYRIYKNNGFSKCVRINDLLKNDDKDQLRKNLSVINATNNEKIFFANNVILVEGITDEILFKKIYESEIGKIPDDLEFVSIEGKKNLDNFKKILEVLKINYFYIGDFDNIYDFKELSSLFCIDKKKQREDLKKKKNQSYDALNLLDSIKNVIDSTNSESIKELKTNYELYNERFKTIKLNISQEEQKKIDRFIDKKYKENFYILKQGEIEDYLGTGNSKKTTAFKKVISFLNEENEYDIFRKSDYFDELKFIIEDINSKIEKDMK